MIKQPLMTSLGFRKEPLETSGTYSSAYACNLWGKDGVYEYVREKHEESDFPYITQEGIDREDSPLSYIKNMHHGSVAGYKYFKFDHEVIIKLLIKAYGKGKIRIWAENEHLQDDRYQMVNNLCDGDPLLVTEIDVEYNEDKHYVKSSIDLNDTVSLYVEYIGEGYIDFYELGFEEK